MGEARSNSGFTNWLATQPVASGRALIAIGAILAAGCVYCLYQSGAWTKPEGLPSSNTALLFTGLWLGWTALAFVGTGSWQLSKREFPSERRPLAARVIWLVLTGAIGGGLFLLGLGLLYVWGDTLSRLLKEGERENAWRLLVALAAVIGGLFLMFAGLQAVRADERQVAGIRRYIYGFNAFLTGFLLLAVLVVINVLCIVKLPATIDATKSGVFTISERGRQVLAELDQPVTLYVLLAPRSELYSEVMGLLTKAQEYTSKLKVETIADYNLEAQRKLLKQHPRLAEEPNGLLIAVNDNPETSSFIPSRDLVSTDFNPMGGGQSNEKFLGEQKLINELAFLLEGKTKPIVYVTQGFGEPDLNDKTKKDGLGNLKERLTRRNFDVRPLKFDLLSPQVPEDAKIVVVAGPKSTYPPNVADAVKGFLEKGGRLILLADVPDIGRGVREMPPTGLEVVMSAYGIDITRERIFSFPVRTMGGVTPPELTLGIVDDRAMNQPIVAPLKTDTFNFMSSRLVRPVAEGGNPSLRAQTLIVTMPRIPVWTETDMQVDADQLLQSWSKDLKEAEKRISKQPLPLMIAVSESQRPLPGQPPPAEKPKIVAFGDSTFVTNQRNDRDAIEFDLLINSLEWLRERASNIGIEPRQYQFYELDRGVPTYIDRLRYLPLLIAFLTVLGLGTGVWLVRRQ